MKQIKVIKNFTINGKEYIIDDVIDNMSYEQTVKLNEKGFIEPLKYEELIKIKRELEKSKEEL